MFICAKVAVCYLKALKIMANIFQLNGTSPRFGKDCFLAPTATVIGDVVCGDECSFWFNCVVRGDVNRIRLGNRVNVQDGAVIHCTYQRSESIIGDNVSIGHNAIVHGCTVESNVLIGMGAIVMDHAMVGEGCVVAAGAVVLAGAELSSGYIYAGVPAKKIKPVPEELRTGEIERIARNYLHYASWYEP
ncbi:MAG: gamma carbonic anhydrase family protein [Salibacteraceae bacterium]